MLNRGAIERMVQILLASPGWKPDRWAVQREKVCQSCGVRKHLEKFSFSGSRCKVCDKAMRDKWIKTGRRA